MRAPHTQSQWRLPLKHSETAFASRSWAPFRQTGRALVEKSPSASTPTKALCKCTCAPSNGSVSTFLTHPQKRVKMSNTCVTPRTAPKSTHACWSSWRLVEDTRTDPSFQTHSDARRVTSLALALDTTVIVMGSLRNQKMPALR